MENSQDICMKLLRAESEAEVLNIVANTPEMQDEENWAPLDGRDTNFNTTSNQSSDGAKALTELMTNMVDAMLIRGCLEKGIDPKDKNNAPKTMYEAANKYFSQPIEGLTTLKSNDPAIKKFQSENHLVVAITGSVRTTEGKPCFTFIDEGEGQTPEKFSTTFLSLSERNKRDIAFVQGKFNMGSSGVLGYSGKHWFKLIISRRFDKNSPWGWTLIRRRPVSKEELPISEYFSPDCRIPDFECESLIPLTNKKGDEFKDISISMGTVVKLYDYRTKTFPSETRLREVFFENLAETVLPFKLLDCRATPNERRSWPRPAGIDERQFLGMESHVRQKIEKLEDSESDENDISADAKLADKIRIEDPELGVIEIKALLLADKKMPPVLKRSRNRFFHTVNGQVQLKKQRGLFSRMRMPYFQERLVILVNSSNLHFNAQNQIWKPDRESIRSTDEGDRYSNLVEKHIEESEALRNLHSELVKEDINKAQSTGTTDLLQKLVNADPTLAKMLQGDDPKITHTGRDSGDNDGKQLFKGKKSPTYVRCIVKDRDFKVQKRGSRIVFITDAEEEYFKRENPGKVEIVPYPDNPKLNISIGNTMIPGRLILYLNPTPETKIGHTFAFKVGLNDDGLAEPVMDADEDGEEKVTTISIVENKKQRKKSPSKNTKDSSKEPELSVPNHIIFVKNPDAPYAKRLENKYEIEKLPDGYTEEDGGEIRGDRENPIFCINYDNRYHLDYRKKQKDANARTVVTIKYIMGMLIAMIGYERVLREFIENDEEMSETDFEQYFRRLAAKGAASTVLALSEKLSNVIDIKTIKSMDDQDD